MALTADIRRLSFSYPGENSPSEQRAAQERAARERALEDVSLRLEPGELVLLLGRSGSGKSTLLRALSGLVPHFHGGRFSGSVSIGGRDTRTASPAELAGEVATLFQDPEDQIVFDSVANEVAFGPLNLGASLERSAELAEQALAAVGAGHLLGRATRELSGGELQRVCLASSLALEPKLLVLDEPTSQLDPEGAEEFLSLVRRLASERGMTVVLSEQRPALPLDLCDRVIVLRDGRIVLDAPKGEAIGWIGREEPAFLSAVSSHTASGPRPEPELRRATREIVCSIEAAGYSYRPRTIALAPTSLELRRGEIVALAGANGSGKTTLAKLACRLIEPQEGTVELHGRAGYLSQDPGRYVVSDRAEEEVALAIEGDLERAHRWLAELGLTGLERRHPRDLSSGERERLGLAAVLATEPDLLVLDEPTRGVDPERKRALGELLRRGSRERATLLVTHDQHFARSIADRVVTLSLTSSRELAYV